MVHRIREALTSFSTYTRLPVNIDDIVDFILEQGLQDELTFHPVSVNAAILKGTILQYTRHDAPYGDPIRVSQILYAASLSLPWQRLVCAKELVHIMDGVGEITRTREEVNLLVTEIVLPPDAQYIPQLAHHTLADHAAVLAALGFLIPFDARRELLPAFKEGRIDAAGVADLAEVPEHYVPMVMADIWPHILCGVARVEPGAFD
jgi:hypothetical protein